MTTSGKFCEDKDCQNGANAKPNDSTPDSMYFNARDDVMLGLSDYYIAESESEFATLLEIVA